MPAVLMYPIKVVWTGVPSVYRCVVNSQELIRLRESSVIVSHNFSNFNDTRIICPIGASSNVGPDSLSMLGFTFLAFDLQKFVEQSLLPVLLLLLLDFKIFAAFLEFRDQPVSLSCSVFRGKSSNFLLFSFGPFLIFCPPGSLG
jgi:hypothetical protein